MSTSVGAATRPWRTRVSAARADRRAASMSGAYVGVLCVRCSPKPAIAHRSVPRSRRRRSALATTTRGAAGARHHDLEHVQRLGDHRERQHVVDRDRLCRGTRRRGWRTRWRAGRRRSWPGPLVPAVLLGVALREHGVAAVLRRRCRTGCRTRPAASPSRCSTRPTRSRGSGGDAGAIGWTGSATSAHDHDLAHARARSPRPPATPSRPPMAPPRSTRSAKFTDQPQYSAIVAGTNSDDSKTSPRAARCRRPRAASMPGVGQGLGGQLRPLLEGEPALTDEGALGPVLGGTDHGCTHGATLGRALRPVPRDQAMT